jgi:hypothetical protein
MELANSIGCLRDFHWGVAQVLRHVMTSQTITRYWLPNHKILAYSCRFGESISSSVCQGHLVVRIHVPSLTRNLSIECEVCN